MHEQQDMLCELWPEEQVEKKPHSRLYSLEPIGVGSPMVESLTSYLARLAEEHSVYPRVLIIDEIAPNLKEFHLYQDGHLVHNHLTAFWQESTILNGITSGTRAWIQALERLTLRSNLCFLTMLTFAEVIPPRKLLRRTRAWCPACYEEWRETGQVVYEPLLWSLEIIRACPRHHQPLQLHCPYSDCRHTLFPLAPHSQPGYCSKCDRWLGSPERGEGEKEHWAEHVAGELLATAPMLPVLPRREWIAATLAIYVSEVMEGNLSALARQLKLNERSLGNWLQGKQLPHMENLMRICCFFKTSLLHLITGKAIETVATLKQAPVESATVEKPKRRYRRFDTKGLHEALKAVLQNVADSPQSMHEVAQHLGYDQSHLYKHFPELCQAISKRYQDYQKVKGEERLLRTCDEVRGAMRRLYEEGYYPSKHRLTKVLPKPGVLRRPEVSAVWHETLRELEWDE